MFLPDSRANFFAFSFNACSTKSLNNKLFPVPFAPRINQVLSFKKSGKYSVRSNIYGIFSTLSILLFLLENPIPFKQHL